MARAFHSSLLSTTSCLDMSLRLVSQTYGYVGDAGHLHLNLCLPGFQVRLSAPRRSWVRTRPFSQTAETSTQPFHKFRPGLEKVPATLVHIEAFRRKPPHWPTSLSIYQLLVITVDLTTGSFRLLIADQCPPNVKPPVRHWFPSCQNTKRAIKVIRRCHSFEQQQSFPVALFYSLSGCARSQNLPWQNGQWKARSSI